MSAAVETGGGGWRGEKRGVWKERENKKREKTEREREEVGVGSGG